MDALAYQARDEVEILDRPDPMTEPSGLEMIENLTNARR